MGLALKLPQDFENACILLNTGPGELCVTFPGGATICAQVGYEIGDIPEIVQNMLDSLNTALAPLVPFLNMIDVIKAIVDCIQAIPDCLSPPSPTPLVECIPNLIEKLNKVVTKRFLKFLAEEAEARPDTYNEFYAEFGIFLKEGAAMDYTHKDSIVKLLRFESSLTEKGKTTSLADYVSRMGSEQKEIYRALKRSLPIARPRFALFSPNLVDPDDASLAGLVRVMTGYSTVLIDLLQPLDALRAAMEGKWRNRLVAAERSKLDIVRLEADPTQYAWLLEEEKAQRDSKSFYGLPVKFVENYIHSRSDTTRTVLILQAQEKGERVAAMLFLIHGSVATYHVGWSNDAGRAVNAHNLLLWRAFEELQALDIKTLDMGGINTRSLPGISRFKIGSGGKVLTYAGTFV